MIGSTISHYKILEKLGEGGMGVVYKATDTKLDRTVALKFLPAHVSINEETKARFVQEAKAAAALNHSHICTIHGVEEDAGQIFIVMEFVDGGTLREKIPFKSIDEAVTVAIQIADALHDAHAKGIVHRDIKADNIMLTSKGQAKVMDFGLAKLKGTLKLTRTSSTVGTLAYMAPEQIQGGEIDTRSDIFSFGALMFEMLTGRTPFRGEHEAAMLYSIVNEEPQPLEQLRQDISPLLSNLILKCLEKDPADRYQHMDDIASELRRAQKKTSRVMRTTDFVPSGAQSAAQPSGTMPRVEQRSEPTMPGGSRTPLLRYGGIGFVAVVVLGVIGWLLLSPSGIAVNPDMVTRVLQVPFTQYSYPSLSPDGKWIAFPAADANGRWDIYYMHISGGEPRKITSDGTIFIQQSADISPDGSQIVYNRPNENNTSYDIVSISSLGGTSRKLAESGGSPQWRPDGERVGFIRTLNSRLRAESSHIEFWTVRADGSDLRRDFEDSLFVTSGPYRYNFCWSPDGKSIAWIRTLSPSSQILVIRNLETGSERLLTEGGENLDAAAWTVDDRIIFSSNRGGNTNLWAIPASGGKTVQVTKGGGPDLALTVASSGNELVYLQQQRVGHIWTANVDGSSLRQISFDEREIWEPAFSPDKQRIAFVMNDPDPLTEKADVYVMDRDGNNRRQMTQGLLNARIPCWSPDGKRVGYTVPQTGEGADTAGARIFVVDVDNPGAPKHAGSNFGVGWLDEDYILSTDGRRSYICDVAKAETKRFFTDSLVVWYLSEDGMLGYYDWRHDKRGWWVVMTQPAAAADLMNQQADVIMPRILGSAHRIEGTAQSFLANWTSTASSAGEFLQYAGEDKAKLISFRRRTERVLSARFPGLRNRSIDISASGKEVIFVTPRLSSRLVFLENVFE